MKAVRFYEYGGPEVLTLEDIDQPTPGAGQIRIAVKAAGINPIDWKIRAGYMREFMPLTLPAGIGIDAAGIVEAIGKDVTGVSVGDAVFGKGNATLAEYAILHEWAQKPETLSFEEAAGFPVAVETATRIIDELDVKSGETLLVSGAAGGVGSALIQLAKASGIRTIGTASAPKHAYLQSLGAIPTTYGPGLVERVAVLVSGGVQAAADVAGSGVIPDLVAITGTPLKVVSISDFHAPEYGVRTLFEEKNSTPALVRAATLFVAGAFTLPVARTFTLNEVGAAHELSAQGHVTGRLVITMD
ncbi:NADP-dependent oxidoreductase [Pseudomonas gingeri]|uniref:NADP-dependent oxidoreductase n=1 Tax=Pseudomonas gingeri TaxID=117681 RepID=UPI0015A257FF|nr:NADP-dependent oxidoreductase [Pseudomonas gingeri]NWA25556.1 NADP-dependent oxidoreductase [Pseudomonas gingeri]NWD68911.1 NADP-dependent oxidoreductase [Pseudomonas gingeri]NWD74476.1 NADP-dependent oxidoreductase [Pseudomonas gingeri]